MGEEEEVDASKMEREQKVEARGRVGDISGKTSPALKLCSGLCL